ncbi:SpdD-like protein [Streptomyces sp. ISL-98]|uniref:SpdD-like protein n=1 Tax=Streptomyces sp. ISL-98 TaxID=2819192 RepID=UPI001BE8FF56|nr:SpdD-like protein [Streptomyces sp. ISL-98]MBT2505299.1 SpdD-like protein [Streptomyces sp. ISL-98]
MFKPKYPTPDTYTVTSHTMAPLPQQDTAPAPRSAAAPASATGAVVDLVKSNPLVAVGGVVVLGAVLTSMFLAVALTAGSLAVLAVVIRSLMHQR